MDVDLLISRFLEESNYDKLDDTLLILAYGSRIMGTDKQNSDLDVLIVTSRNVSYRRAMLVDGIPIDITYISLLDLEHRIYESNANNSTYYNSIFKHGKVVLDRMNIFETLENMLNKKVPRKNRLDGRIISKVKYLIREFINTSEDIYYFKALELLRRLHHVNNGDSYIRFTKVYDLYTDKTKAKDLYMLKLPDEEYRETYLKALNELDPKKRLEYLEYFYHEFENVKFRRVDEEFYLDEEEIKKRLFQINGAVIKCEDMLAVNHPYAKCLYYILLEDMYYLYELLYDQELEKIEHDSDDVNVLIDNLENIFSRLEGNRKIDYNDVTLKL